jgi:hypothetical protein
MCVRFLANKVALVEIVLREIRFSFSVLLNQCSIRSFFYTLLVPEGKIDEVWGHLKNNADAEIEYRFIVMHFHFLGAFEELTKSDY